MFLLVLFSALTLFAFIWFQFRYGRFIRLGNNIPGPKNIYILGNAHLFINIPIEDNLKMIGDYFLQYGDTFRIWIGSDLNIFFKNINDLEFILSGMTFANKSDVYDFIKPWLNEGLLINKGKKWQSRRKIITPAFHFKILEEQIHVFEEQSENLCKILQGHSNMNSVDMYEYVNRYTLDVISESAMGVSVNAQKNFDSDYVRAVKTISTVLHKRMFNIFYRFNFTYQFTQLARDEKKALKVLHGFTEKIISQRRQEILQQKNTNIQQDVNDVGSKRKMAFLDILLQSNIDGKPLSNLDIREEVDTFMFEGHDTTSSAITFFMYNIAIYPEAQKKCFKEIREIFGNNRSKSATYEDLSNLHYTELCIKETLRLYPSVPLLGRKVLKECEINGKIIPAGTNIAVSPFYLGRSEEIFPKANEFIPERFDIVTNTEKINPYAYIPFSAGPRNCIGQKFAMLEMKSVIANVLRNFEVEYVGTTSGEPVLVAELILRTRDPLMFKLRPRTYE